VVRGFLSIKTTTKKCTEKRGKEKKGRLEEKVIGEKKNRDRGGENEAGQGEQEKIIPVSNTTGKKLPGKVVNLKKGTKKSKKRNLKKGERKVTAGSGGETSSSDRKNVVEEVKLRQYLVNRRLWKGRKARGKW